MVNAQTFLEALYAGQTGVLELRTFDHSQAHKLRDFIPVENGKFESAGVLKFLEKTIELRLGAFFGVALRSTSSIKTKKGDSSHCHVLTALFVDADFKHLGEAVTRQRITDFPLPPSALICSGGGLHPYWFLEEPIFLQAPGGMQRAKSALRRLARSVADVVDESVSEPVRVLRVAGGTNFKYDPPRDVVVEVFEPSRRYSLAELEAVFPPDPAEGKPARFEVPEEIAKGDRHGLLFALLRSCKARGLSMTAALAACHAENLEKCKPPISHKVLDDYLKRSWATPDQAGFVSIVPGLICNKGIPIANNQENIRFAFGKMGAELSYDIFAQKPRLKWKGYDGPLEDRFATRLWLDLETEFKFRPTRDYYDAVLLDTAYRNSFHPVRMYLQSLEWDGVKRVDEWLIKCAKANDNPFVRSVSSLILIAAVKRVMHPGCKFDELAVLESGQGWHKSTALRALCPRDSWFSDDLPLDVEAKQLIERTAGKWLIEASDLSGMRKSLVEHLKALLSRQVDGPVRLAYARLPVEVPRQFIVIGTTNAESYLRDSTGNRRFWPIRVDRFDVKAVRAMRDQLWAEATAREAAGESIRLNTDLYGHAAMQQERRLTEDPWEVILSEAFDTDIEHRITYNDVWELLGVSVAHRDESSQARLVAVMQKLGFRKSAIRDKQGKRQKDGCYKVVKGWARDFVSGQAALPVTPVTPESTSSTAN